MVLHAGFRRFSARPIYSEIPRRTGRNLGTVQHNKRPVFTVEFLRSAGSLRPTRSTSSLASYTKRLSLAMYSSQGFSSSLCSSESFIISLVSGHCVCFVLCPSGRELRLTALDSPWPKKTDNPQKSDCQKPSKTKVFPPCRLLMSVQPEGVGGSLSESGLTHGSLQ